MTGPDIPGPLPGGHHDRFLAVAHVYRTYRLLDMAPAEAAYHTAAHFAWFTCHLMGQDTPGYLRYLECWKLADAWDASILGRPVYWWLQRGDLGGPRRTRPGPPTAEPGRALGGP